MFPNLQRELPQIEYKIPLRWTLIEEKNYMLYENYRLLNYTSSSHSLMKFSVAGYRQNWRYFQEHSQTLHHMFQLRDILTTKAGYIIESQIKKARSANVTTVGVHVRRGDMVYNSSREYGYTMADTTFFLTAMDIMLQKYKSSGSLVFFIVSDSIELVEQEFNNYTNVYDMYFVNTFDWQLDFAILTLMDHTIISGGTFGFWAAWLADGDVISFRDYARPGSALERAGYCSKCVSLPHWTTLGGNELKYFPVR